MFHRKRILFQIDTISTSETWTQTKLNWSFWIIWSNIESRVASNGDKKQTMELGKKEQIFGVFALFKIEPKGAIKILNIKDERLQRQKIIYDQLWVL